MDKTDTKMLSSLRDVFRNGSTKSPNPKQNYLMTWEQCGFRSACVSKQSYNSKLVAYICGEAHSVEKSDISSKLEK